MNTDTKCKAVRTLLDAMRELDLLDDDAATKAGELLTVADAANATARNYETTRLDTARKAAQQLASRPFDADKIIKAAATLPTTDAVDLIAREVRAHTVSTAHALVFARVHEVPSVITALYDDLREQAETLESALSNVSTPQTAIDAGKTAEWQAIKAVQHAFKQLTAWVEEFRASGLIAAPAGSNRGSHWSYRIPLKTEQFHQAIELKERDGGRALLLVTLRAQPYVPASRDEAIAMANAWAEVAA